MAGKIVVLQTTSGGENRLTAYLETMDALKELAADIFIPMRQVKKRFRGEWHTVTEKLFPGYLFVETTDPNELYFVLKRIPMLSKLLGDREMDYITLEPEEENFIRRIGRERGDHSIAVSTVEILSDMPYQKGDRVNVISGGLKDFEGEVVGYDFRKRKAMIQTGLFGGTVIHVGIELLVKSSENPDIPGAERK